MTNPDTTPPLPDSPVWETVQQLLKELEFQVFNDMKCPICLGWDGSKNGRGETPERHTKDCRLKAAIAALALTREQQAETEQAFIEYAKAWQSRAEAAEASLTERTAELAEVEASLATEREHYGPLQQLNLELLTEQERLREALKAASAELWATYTDTPRLRPLFVQIDAALDSSEALTPAPRQETP